MKLITYNCNSINKRLHIIEKLTNERSPDVICLQETKVHDDRFPIEEMQKLGFEHLLFTGNGGQSGVAVLSKLPIIEVSRLDIVNSGKRHLCFSIKRSKQEPLLIHNFYIPAGGDIPDVNVNTKFEQKLKFLHWITEFFSKVQNNTIILGDINIAPLENDVYNHKKLLKEVSHSPIEIEILANLVQKGNFIDIARHFTPHDQKLYSWWSYRVWNSFEKDYGRRLDHIYCTADLLKDVIASTILKDYRRLESPSDHVPVEIDVKIE